MVSEWFFERYFECYFVLFVPFSGIKDIIASPVNEAI